MVGPSQDDIDRVPRSLYNSIPNFRDVGISINAVTGQLLLPEKLLFRSALLDHASLSAREGIMRNAQIKTVIDLRSRTEHLQAAKKPRWTNEPAPDIQSPDIREISLTGAAFERALIWRLSWWGLGRVLYYYFLGNRLAAISILGSEVMNPQGLLGLGQDTLAASTAEIRSIFAILADPKSYPVLIHCTQGKDRTGIIFLLLLLLLHVPLPAIQADYAASERELATEREARVAQMAAIGLGPEFASCPPDFVAGMAHYLEWWGGVAGYLESIGVHKAMQERVMACLAVRRTPAHTEGHGNAKQGADR